MPLTKDSETKSLNLGLYVHIPFCETKCTYCDFNTYEKLEHLMPSYIEALSKEISFWGNHLEHSFVDTIFLGGGTPSYLPEDSIKTLVETIYLNYELASPTEFTIECNPCDLSPIIVQTYLSLGINRLSVGVQSLSDQLLEVLGRRHDSRTAISALNMARSEGVCNISADLIYGLPYQTLSHWTETLKKIIDLELPHISMYCLTLEKGTPLEIWVKSGRLPNPDTDLAADMYELGMDYMTAAGYEHYEISNWSIEGYQSNHNLRYWRNQNYLGVGPGAHSYLNKERFSNLKSPRDYINLMLSLYSTKDYFDEDGSLQTTDLPMVETVEKIGRELEIAETLMMGLRLSEGIKISDFKNRFGITPEGMYKDTITELLSHKLIERNQSSIKLTERGRLLGNEVFSRFLEPLL